MAISNKPTRIGLSLSYCLRVMVEAGMKANDVDIIYANTAYPNLQKLKIGLRKEGEVRFEGADLERYVQLGVELWQAGKIVQHRRWFWYRLWVWLTSRDTRAFCTYNGHWADSPKDVHLWSLKKRCPICSDKP